MTRKKTDPLEVESWTAEGSNGADPPVRVGVWGDPDDCRIWTSQQNERQTQEDWGRGGAGPMRWRPVPIYGAPWDGRRGRYDHTVVLPERRWERPDDAD